MPVAGGVADGGGDVFGAGVEAGVVEEELDAGDAVGEAGAQGEEVGVGVLWRMRGEGAGVLEETWIRESQLRCDREGETERKWDGYHRGARRAAGQKGRWHPCALVRVRSREGRWWVGGWWC